jgi:hypothetical protein
MNESLERRKQPDPMEYVTARQKQEVMMKPEEEIGLYD